MADFESMLAGDGDLGSYSPLQIFSGGAPIKTNASLVKSNQKLDALTVMAFDENDLLVKHNPAAAAVAVTGGATSQTRPNRATIAVGILAQSIDTTVTGTNADTFGPWYEAGCFNPDVLIWDASLDTYKERQRAFVGTEIQIKRLL